MRPLTCFVLFSLFVIQASSLVYAQEFSSIKQKIISGNEDEAILLLNEIEDKNNISYLNLIGDAHMRKGFYDEALKNFEKAAYLQEQNPNHDKLQLADTYSFIAILHFTTGNDQLSLQYHFKALDLRRQQNNTAAIAASTNDIGLVYSRSNPEKALTYYKEALADYLELYGDADDRTATAYTNIGIAYRNMTAYEEALENLAKALEIRQQLARGSTQEAFVHASIGTVYSANKEPDKALQELDIALVIYRKNYGAKHPEIASTHNLIGNILNAQGKFMEALYNYQRALMANVTDFDSRDLYQNPALSNYYNADVLLSSLFRKAEAFENLHNAFSLKIKDLTMAFTTISLGDSLIDKIRQFRSSESDKVALGNLAAELYESAIRISLNMADIKWQKLPYQEKAFYFSDKSKSAVLLEAIVDANAKSFAGIPDDLLAQEKIFKAEVTYYEQKLAGKPTADEEVLYRKELFDWTKNYNELIASLEELYPTYFNLKHNARVPDVTAIQEKLKAGSALISYFVATNDSLVYAFVITKKKLKVHEIPLQNNYETNISGYRNAMYYDAPNTYKQTARALYDQLLSFSLPANIKKLIIVPSGRMATIPFESLITRDIDITTTRFADIPYLINDYFISYLYAASLFLNPHVEMPPEPTISLFAPVEFSGRRLSTLPGTESEVKDIGKLFAGSSADVSMFLADEATVNEVKSPQVTQSKYLHFATHGIVDEMRPERSQICLATGEDDMGSLFSGDIYSLTLSADLVVLSACETGLGKISKGEGIIGLTRALIYAGSNNLVVSLWRVGDASTSLLMTDFYRSMLQGNSYAEALSYAKLGMINSAEYSSPYYWAPFVLIGE
jgi:CHAT domain-containing protein/tetratricopeptide (TPR) repeat protein